MMFEIMIVIVIDFGDASPVVGQSSFPENPADREDKPGPRDGTKRA